MKGMKGGKSERKENKVETDKEASKHTGSPTTSDAIVRQKNILCARYYGLLACMWQVSKQ